MAAEIANFVVLSLSQGMNMVNHPLNSCEYTYIASAINIALTTLEVADTE